MAILKRRDRRGILKKIKESLWPTMGWRRTANYYHHRIFRTGDSAYKIAAGLAMGAAVSFTPFFGTHVAQAIFFSWLIKANLVAGFVGTAVGNPWTFPFIVYSVYSTGIWICGLFGLSDFVVLEGHLNIIEEPWAFVSYMFSHPVKLLLPMTLGGYLLGGVAWFVFYAVLYYPVRRIRRVYRKQRLLRYYKKRHNFKKKVMVRDGHPKQGKKA